MKYSILVFFILGIFSCSSCRDKECDFPAAYEFVIPATLYPAQDTFNIGDTITVTSNFSDMVYDQKTKKKYHLVDFRFYPVTTIYKLDTSIISYNLTDFDIVVDTAYKYNYLNLSDGNKQVVGQYRYSTTRYSLEYKIIPKRKGLFFHRFGVDVGIDQFQDFEGKCRNKGSSATVKLNEGEDNNVDFLLESGNEDYPRLYWDKKEERFYKHGGYCFYIK